MLWLLRLRCLWAATSSKSVLGPQAMLLVRWAGCTDRSDKVVRSRRSPWKVWVPFLWLWTWWCSWWAVVGSRTGWSWSNCDVLGWLYRSSSVVSGIVRLWRKHLPSGQVPRSMGQVVGSRRSPHHVFHSASLGFLEDWAYMSFSRSMMSWSSSLVMVLSRARFMLPLPRVCTGRSGLVVAGSDSCMTKMSGPWRLSHILLVDRLSRPFSWNVVMSVALKESMSSIPISATLMARSPMLLARSQSRMSLNPMALSKKNVTWKRGGCVVNKGCFVYVWVIMTCMYLNVGIMSSIECHVCHDLMKWNFKVALNLKWSHSWCHCGCGPGLSLPWM